MDIDFPLNWKAFSLLILDIYSVKSSHCNTTQQQTFLSANSTSLQANNLYIFIYSQTQAAAPPIARRQDLRQFDLKRLGHQMDIF
jgi:hypothetical protein